MKLVKQFKLTRYNKTVDGSPGYKILKTEPQGWEGII